MTEEVANVLTQDGPEVEEAEITAEETPTAEAEESGEEKPQADADKGEEAEHKRLGGFKRKVLKAQQEAEFWREEALRSRKTEGKETAAEPDPDKPKRPKLSEFQGTVEEFDKAQDEYEAKLERWTETKAQQDAVTRQIETSVASLTKKVADLPEWDEMKAAVQEHKMPLRLTNVLVAEAAKLTNGAETLKALLLDPEEAAQLANLDRFEDEVGIKAQIISMSRALRIAGKKSEPVEEVEVKTAPEPPPKPINPVKKVAPTATGLDDNLSVDEWRRRREAQLKRK